MCSSPYPLRAKKFGPIVRTREKDTRGKNDGKREKKEQLDV